ncbi:alkaline phosphatase family protein [Pseudophaeobacter sp. EL27]|uniref:alkaline phosphatase family protein n=1 Tax=Pseudophaeobacter sp. EL27 TaxID=2107580 RepID=UPI000EFD0E4E|nr:alkaline phosphatase family protein [Pseudophaeobacter sp. EL27]
MLGRIPALNAAGIATLLLSTTAFAQEAEAPPKLVLQITVDQLRGDMIDRFRAGLGKGGFNRLLKSGVHFANAHHRHANTETIVGHTTLSTGTDPGIHGMVANLWFDRGTGTTFYNVQDPDYPLVGALGVDAGTEIDPTQRAATTDGRSPRNILTSTIGDEIRMHYGPDTKVFGVSVKDRGAISFAGHSGQAYWFSKSEGRFVTSTFYREDYPAWMSDWELQGFVNSYADSVWTPMLPAENYLFWDKDDQPWETDFPGFGRTFPHAYPMEDNRYYTTLLTLSPAGDEVTVDFAKALMSAEAVGQDDVPDFMSVSLSSTDYVGHIFGPSSLEAEDNFKRLDQTLADFLDFVDDSVGLDQTLVVLSSDHGAPEAPGYLNSLGIEAQSFEFEAAAKSAGFARLKERFGIGEALLNSFTNPYVYLDRAAIEAAGATLAEVEEAVAAELQKMPGIAFAITSSNLRRGAVPDTKIARAVMANFHADRSGDIYVVFEPHWFVAEFDSLTVASAHGSPWIYDTHVPVIFSGAGIVNARVERRVETVDVAATIASIMRTKPLSGAVGLPLLEALQ